jgi:hypothetical protein
LEDECNASQPNRALTGTLDQHVLRAVYTFYTTIVFTWSTRRVSAGDRETARRNVACIVLPAQNTSDPENVMQAEQTEAEPKRAPPEIPVVPKPEPEMPTDERPGPEIPQLPPDPLIAPSPQAPEVIPQPSPEEIPPAVPDQDG